MLCACASESCEMGRAAERASSWCTVDSRAGPAAAAARAAAPADDPSSNPVAPGPGKSQPPCPTAVTEQCSGCWRPAGRQRAQRQLSLQRLPRRASIPVLTWSCGSARCELPLRRAICMCTPPYHLHSVLFNYNLFCSQQCRFKKDEWATCGEGAGLAPAAAASGEGRHQSIKCGQRTKWSFVRASCGERAGAGRRPSGMVDRQCFHRQ